MSIKNLFHTYFYFVFSQFFYDLTLTAYQTALHMAAPFYQKAALMQRGRQQLWQQLQATFQQIHQPKQQPVAWFHCASLGEFEQARPLIEAFRQQYSHYKIVLTFFSPSGYEIRKNYDQADVVCYLPFDSAANATQWFELVKPSIIFFVKYEFWHYYLQTAKQRQIPTLSFSAIFRPEQLFFKPYGKFYRQILFNFSHLFVQNKQSVDLLQKIGIQQVSQAGDTRFDRVLQIKTQRKNLDWVTTFKENNLLLVVGSAWADDMAVLAPVLATTNLRLKIIIAPHEILPQHLAQTEKQLKQYNSQLTILRHSQIAAETDLRNYQILIIDNIGLLSSLYAYGDMAFIGGAYKDGLHNILEAAVFGMPIFFGNRNYKKFQEAIDLLALGGAFLVTNSKEFAEKLDFYAQNHNQRQQVALLTANYVKENEGGTKKILDFIMNILN